VIGASGPALPGPDAVPRPGKPVARYSASADQRYDNAAFDGTIR
jgi:hypothetical protein